MIHNLVQRKKKSLNKEESDLSFSKHMRKWFPRLKWIYKKHKICSGSMESFMIPCRNTNIFPSLWKDQFPYMDFIKCKSKSPTLALRSLHAAIRNRIYSETSQASKAPQREFTSLSSIANHFVLKVFPSVANNHFRLNLEKSSKSGAFWKFVLYSNVGLTCKIIWASIWLSSMTAYNMWLKKVINV